MSEEALSAITMDSSILRSVAKLIGGEDNGEYFNPDLIADINTSLSFLTRVGVGPASGFAIKDDSSKWSDFIGSEDPRFSMVISYVHLKTKMLFDPPASSVLRDALKEAIDEAEWSAYMEADTQRIDSENEASESDGE